MCFLKKDTGIDIIILLYNIRFCIIKNDLYLMFTTSLVKLFELQISSKEESTQSDVVWLIWKIHPWLKVDCLPLVYITCATVATGCVWT